MAWGRVSRWAAAAALVSLVWCAPWPARAEDTPAPFAYTWKIVFRGDEIGHARSDFTYLYRGQDLCLAETGKRQFVARFAGFVVDFSEETTVLWDPSGLMLTYTSRSSVRGHVTERSAARLADGTVVWTSASDGSVKEKRFSPDEFVYTDADRFVGRLGLESGPRTVRLLSMRNGKVHAITCRYQGKKEVSVGGKRLVVTEVTMKGPGTDGTLSMEKHGIPLGFTMHSLFGDFSFVPTGAY